MNTGVIELEVSSNRGEGEVYNFCHVNNRYQEDRTTDW